MPQVEEQSDQLPKADQTPLTKENLLKVFPCLIK
jgi:hypothetical protein